MISYHTCPLAEVGRGQAGGLNVYVRNLAYELARRGALVDIYTRQASPSVEPVAQAAEGITVLHVPAGPPQEVPKAALVEHVPEFAHSLQLHLLTRSYDIVHSHYWLSGWAVMAAGVAGKIPWLHMAHTWAHLKDSSFVSRRQTDAPQRAVVEASIARSCDLLITATSREKLFVTWAYGADPDRIRVVPCGVDTSLFSPGDRGQARRELGLAEHSPLATFVGRLDPIKGLDVLLRAVALLGHRTSDLRGPFLLVVGGESAPGEAHRLVELCEQLGIADLVRFVGPVPHHQLPRYYRAADVAVMPSLYESFGMALLEAMACGIPAVATKVDGPSNFVLDRFSGLLVPPGDALALANALEQLITDESTRRRLASNAFHTVANYRWEAVAHSVLEAYADTLCPVARQVRLTAV